MGQDRAAALKALGEQNPPVLGSGEQAARAAAAALPSCTLGFQTAPLWSGWDKRVPGSTGPKAWGETDIPLGAALLRVWPLETASFSSMPAPSPATQGEGNTLEAPVHSVGFRVNTAPQLQRRGAEGSADAVGHSFASH